MSVCGKPPLSPPPRRNLFPVGSSNGGGSFPTTPPPHPLPPPPWITVEYVELIIPLDKKKLRDGCSIHPTLAPLVVAQEQAPRPTQAHEKMGQRIGFGMWTEDGLFRGMNNLKEELDKRLFITAETRRVYIANTNDPTFGYRVDSKFALPQNYEQSVHNSLSKNNAATTKSHIEKYHAARFIADEQIDLSSLMDPTCGFIHHLQIKGRLIPISWNNFCGQELELVSTNVKRSGQEVAIAFKFRKLIFEAWEKAGRPPLTQPQPSSASMVRTFIYF